MDFTLRFTYFSLDFSANYKTVYLFNMYKNKFRNTVHFVTRISNYKFTVLSTPNYKKPSQLGYSRNDMFQLTIYIIFM